MNQILIFSQPLNYVKKEESDQIEKKAIDQYIIKRISQFLRGQDLVMKSQKKYWRYQKRNLRNSLKCFKLLILFIVIFR